MRRLFLSYGVLIGFLFIPGTAAAAPVTDVKVEILPLDCVFEIIADGLNTVTYLTPETCNPSTKEPASPATAKTGQQPPVARLRTPVITDTSSTFLPQEPDRLKSLPGSPTPGDNHPPANGWNIVVPLAGVAAAGLIGGVIWYGARLRR